MLTRRLAVLLLVLMFVQMLGADNGRRRHWSEGVYFPPRTTPQQESTNGYAAGRQRANPWATRTDTEVQQRLPTPESLGYPSVDYDPYQGKEEDRLRADPWATRRDDEDQRRLTTPESLGYPSIGYDPYQGVDAGRIRRYGGRIRAYVPGPAYVPGTIYYPEGYEREGNVSAYSRGDPIRPYAEDYRPGVYSPPWDAALYNPFYGRRTYPWVGGYPFYDAIELGLPFLPSW